MVRLHFTEYLTLTRNLGKYKQLKLVNRELKNGYIELSDEEYVVIKRLSKREPVVAKVRKRLKRPQCSCETLDNACVPPCIFDLVRQAVKGINLTHQGRFAVVSVMKDAGVIPESIVAVFAASPDYDAGHTRYQIKHIFDKDYTSPSCPWMKRAHLCVPNANCAEVESPMDYYDRAERVKKATEK